MPLVIYVMWHPAFTDGPPLARALLEWCSGGCADLRAAGLGIPVFFRSSPWSAELALEDKDVPDPSPEPGDPQRERERALSVWRRPIDLDDASHNIFIPLVDDNMVDDASWRRDLIELAVRHRETREHIGGDRDGVRIDLAPIQITSAWTRLHAINEIQPLFLRRWDEALDASPDVRLQLWRIRIRRLVTQALVRVLREYGSTSLPTEIFLSHAKADRELGPGVAERIRDIAAGYGQIEVFYDENDLPSGVEWANRLTRAVRDGAGFVAVLSDAYATRYWCRREVQLARTPMLVTDIGSATGYVWRVRPTVVTVTMANKWSQLVGDISTVPAIRWQGDEACATGILDQVFREALVSEFQIRYAQMLHGLAGRIAPQTGSMPLAYVTWTLDPATLLRFIGKAREQLADGGLVIYPGQGYLPAEEAELTSAMDTKTCFVPFERFADLLHGNPSSWSDLLRNARLHESVVPLAQQPIIALSAGDSDNLASLGYDAGSGSLHLDEAVLRLCRAILQGQSRLAYGGVLRSASSFTELLHDVVVAMAVRSSDGLDAVPDPVTPLEAWIAKPFEDAFTVQVRAAHFGLCRYFVVGQRAAPDASPEERARVTSEALTAMRRELAQRTRLTVAVAGKRWGFSGLMPGVAEEILFACEQTEDVRVLLLGEYGGVVREIVRYVLGRTSALPPSLTLAGQLERNDSHLRLLLSNDEVHAHAAARYADLAICVDRLRTIALQPDNTPLPRLGLTVGDWKHVMLTASIGFVRRLMLANVLPALRTPNFG